MAQSSSLEYIAAMINHARQVCSQIRAPQIREVIIDLDEMERELAEMAQALTQQEEQPEQPLQRPRRPQRGVNIPPRPERPQRTQQPGPEETPPTEASKKVTRRVTLADVLHKLATHNEVGQMKEFDS